MYACIKVLMTVHECKIVCMYVSINLGNGSVYCVHMCL